MIFDRAWAEAVVAHLQPVFDADGPDWSFHGIADPPVALLWEALPTAFAARHPDAGIVSPEKIPCLDYWFYLDTDVVNLSWEGYPLVDPQLVPTGDGDVDGRALASRLAEYLHTEEPDA